MVELDDINKIGCMVQDAGLDEALIGKLRENWPEIHFTCCSDDDVTQAMPVFENSDFHIYLVDNSNHCISFTSNHENATGVVIAECEDDT